MNQTSYTKPVLYNDVAEWFVTLTNLMRFCENLKEISEEPECDKTSDKEQLMSDIKVKSHKTVQV